VDQGVDVEAALEGAHRAESRIAERRWAEAWGPAGVADHVASRRMLTELAPYRETAYPILMEALERRGTVAEALRAYERLRVLTRR
jgi:DNA-binding SARP family transcriptional activator